VLARANEEAETRAGADVEPVETTEPNSSRPAKSTAPDSAQKPKPARHKKNPARSVNQEKSETPNATGPEAQSAAEPASARASEQESKIENTEPGQS
jgi:hypothetical protein